MAAGARARHPQAVLDTTPEKPTPSPARRVHDAVRHPRLARELATIEAMVRMHCRDRHGTRRGLCGACDTLMTYATRRLDRCVFGDAKPTCANCKVHCYNAAMREQVRTVMRHSGPRMIWRHPLLAIAHLRDGRRLAPDLPQPNRPRTPA